MGPQTTFVTRKKSPVIGLMFGFLLFLSAPAVANTITVTGTGDSVAADGFVTLREAICAANNNAVCGDAPAGGLGVDVIAFNIAGAGVHTIKPLTPLPAIVSTTTIDGYTQPGASPNTLLNGSDAVLLVEIDGSLAGTGFNAIGLLLQGPNITVKGLVVNNFEYYGMQVQSTAVGGNVIEGNFVGTDPTGTVSRPNKEAGVWVYASPNTRVGGTTAGARNVISGNGAVVGNNGIGIEVAENLPDGTHSTTIQGNYIGTNAAGNAVLRNTGAGIDMMAAENVTIGGTSQAARNVISGNLRGIDGSSCKTVSIQGNFIGTDITGTLDFGNKFAGLRFQNCVDVQVGGTSAGARNIISGNSDAGVEIMSDLSTGVIVQGNYIGTDVTGTVALANNEGVVFSAGSPSGNKIGGAASGAGNLISGNRYSGISIRADQPGNNLVQGNLIGTNAAGTAALGNGDPILLDGNGIYIRTTAAANRIGGNAQGEGNVISGNNGFGITVLEAQNQTISGNLIGTDIGGSNPLGNARTGITLNTAMGTMIGGTAANAGNIIAFNGYDGVVGEVAPTTGNSILGNSIYANTRSDIPSIGLGIDLMGDGVSLNDADDSDTGANNLQNFPVLSSAASNGGVTTITGSLNSESNTQYRLEFFASAQVDSSGYGEGQIFLGSANVTTAGNNVNFNINFPVTVPAGFIITATATDPAGNTSEFSQGILLGGQSGGGLLQFSAPTYSVNENGVTATITVSRSGGNTGPVSVQFATSDGTAQDGFEYTAASGTLNWPSGDLSNKSFTVQITDDQLDGPDKDLKVTLSNPTGGAAVGAQNMAVLTIVDDDPAPGISISDVSVVEGNSGVMNATFDLTLSAPSQRSVFVTLGTASGTASSDVDFFNVSGTFTFNPGQTSKTVTVQIVGDTTPEPDETFFVNLSSPVFCNIVKGQGTGTITNDDGPIIISLQFSGPTYTVGEGAGNATITATRTGGSTGAVSVQYATAAGGTATAGTDYTSVSGTLNWPDGDTANKTFTVPITNDTLNENNETVNLVLASPGGGALLGAQGTATLTINDNDAQPSLSITDASVMEGNSGTANLTFNVNLSAASGKTVTVNYANTIGGTATAGPDYQLASGSLTFNPGEVAKQVTVLVNGDTTQEPDETVLLVLSGQTNSTLGKAQGTGTIINDDAPPASVLQFSSATYNVGEGAGSATITVTRTSGSTGAISVQYATAAGGTATAGSDYTAVSGVLNWADGDTASKSFVVPITNDALNENDETVNLILINPGGGATLGAQVTGTLTITDDDALPAVSVTDTSVIEGNSGTSNLTFNVNLSAASGKTVTVNYSTSGGTATAGTDYQAASGTLTFNPGETSKQIAVTVNSDTQQEPDETVLLVLSGQINSALGNAQGTGTIIDDDAAVVISLQFSSATYTAGEGSGSATITATRTGGSTGAVTVQYATTAGGTATASTDYTTVSGVLNWADGDAANKTFVVPIANDSLNENNETVNLILSNPGGGASLGAQGTAVLTITDDDTQPSVSVTDTNVIEGNSGTSNLTFNVNLSAASGKTVTVNYATTAGGTATAGTDFQVASGTLTFNPGETSKQVVVTVNSDTQQEPDETVLLALSGQTNATLGNAQSTGTIIDDDAAVVISLQFSAATYTVGEGAGTATITATRAGSSTGAVSVQYATVAGGTATAGSDYTAISGTLNWADGDTANKTFIVPITNDALNENNETVNLVLTGPGGGASLGAQGTATLTITDDDSQPSLSVSDASVVEGNSGTSNLTFNVNLSAASSQTVTVNFATSGGTGTVGTDYQAMSGTLTFDPGETSKQVVVTVNGDTTQEPDETVLLVLSGQTNSTLGNTQGTGTIINDDSPVAPTLQFSAATYSIQEALTTATITVTRTGDTSGTATVNYATSDGTAAQKGDYSPALGTLTFSSGESSKTFEVLISEDNFVEGDETILLTLSTAGGATLGSQSTAILTLNDDQPETATNPNDDAQSFVNQHYHDLLNREPDAGGLAYWTNEITKCGADQECIKARRRDVSAAFYIEQEFQQTGSFVYRIRKASLGVKPNYMEFMADRSQISTGANMESSKLTFVDRWVTTPQFKSAYPDTMTPDEFTTKLFNSAGLSLYDVERQLATAALATNQKTRAQVVRDVADLQPFVTREYNPAFVLMQYFGYLHREPETGGFLFWLDVLNNKLPNDTTGYRSMVCAFITSAEYQDRFSAIHLHSNQECGP